MARQEKDREDLMAEARNFVQRCELRVPGEELPVLAGFRRDGRMSLYFGPDPVYHFDNAGRIRRAFVTGRLYKAEWGRLIQLTRRREHEATYLMRRELAEQESGEWLAAASGRIQHLRHVLVRGEQQVLRQVPADIDVSSRLGEALDRVCQGPLRLASSPRSL